MSALKGRHFLSTGGAFTLFLAGLWSIMVSSGGKWGFKTYVYRRIQTFYRR